MVDDTLAPSTIAAMTPEQATAALAAMTPPPNFTVPVADSRDARARLDHLSKDASFANALFAGSSAARKQFDGLIAASVAGDDVGDAVAGIVETPPLFDVTAFGSLPRSVVTSTVADLLDAGLDSRSVEQAINLPPVPRAERKLVEAFRTKCHGDADWCKRLLSGDYSATREFKLISIVMASPIRED